LSTILFNLYTNDFCLPLKSSYKGINNDNKVICVLMYAYGIVLIAENEDNLQYLLTMLNKMIRKTCLDIVK